MLGTWIGCRRARLPFWQVADCIAPGLILAQALGRWGNYANQELYGHPSSLPWAVKIDPAAAELAPRHPPREQHAACEQKPVPAGLQSPHPEDVGTRRAGDRKQDQRAGS